MPHAGGGGITHAGGCIITPPFTEGKAHVMGGMAELRPRVLLAVPPSQCSCLCASCICCAWPGLHGVVQHVGGALMQMGGAPTPGPRPRR